MRCDNSKRGCDWQGTLEGRQWWENLSPQGPLGTPGWSPEGRIKEQLNLLDNKCKSNLLLHETEAYNCIIMYIQVTVKTELNVRR